MKQLKTIEINKRDAYILWEASISLGIRIKDSTKEKLFDAFGGQKSEFYKIWAMSQK